MKKINHIASHSWQSAIRYRRSLLAIVFFFAYATFMTWPFLIHPLSTQTSALYGDNFSSITKFDALKFEGKNPFIDGHLSSIAHPDGIRTNVGVDRVSFFSTSILYYGTLIANSVFAHGVFTLLGLFLSGIAIYFFARKYIGGEQYAYLAGLLYCCFPLMISLQRAAPVYMHMWLYVLIIWSLVSVIKANAISRKRIILILSCAALGMFWTPYFTLHTLIIFLAGIVFLTVYLFRKTGKIPVKPVAILTGAIVLMCGLYYLIGHSSSYASIPNRPLSDAYEQSLHPLMLILPNADTWWSLQIYKSVIQPLQPQVGEFTLYVGVVLVIFALLGVWASLTDRTRPTQKAVYIFIITLLLAALAFSLAPTIHLLGLKIPTPNYFVVHAVPALRAGQRLLALIVFCLILLAMIGIKWLMEHRYTNRNIRKSMRYLLFSTIAIVTIADIMPSPWHSTASMIRTPESMKIFSSKQVLVAEYMNNSLLGYPGQLACKNYLAHHQAMVNSCGLDIYTDPGKWPVIESIARNDIRTQLIQLRQLGVSYVILDSTSHETIKYLADHHLLPVAKDDKFWIYHLNAELENL